MQEPENANIATLSLSNIKKIRGALVQERAFRVIFPEVKRPEGLLARSLVKP